MSELFALRFPLKSEMMTTVRLAAGGVCSLYGLDFDASEDCKVCVTESLLLLLHRGYRTASVRFFGGETLRLRIEGEEAGDEIPSPEDEISLALLGALLGDLQTEERENRLFALSFSVGKQA